jgi:pimeloyl-ACP methyl ester carboxylesterase
MRRAVRWARWLLPAIAVATLLGCLSIRTPAPDQFYRAPVSAPHEPGALLRIEPFTRKIPKGARAWKILYTTTRSNGAAAVASALVLAPLAAHEGPRPLIAWLHGTTGVIPGCAPSLLRQPYVDIPPLDKALAEGWAVVATDYVGLGTEGPNPFLIGEGEARSALDSIRAARQLRDLQLADSVVVWGASQGGNAALWSGILAPTYAPDVNLRGVVGIAPATDLPSLVKADENTLAGRIISSFILSAYGEEYPEVRLQDYIAPDLQARARSMAGRCLAMPQVLPSALQSWLTARPIFSADPREGALGRRLDQNTPRGHIAVPVLIAQGEDDDLVLPPIQDRYVEERRRAGQELDYRKYAGRHHVSVVMEGSPFNPELIEWTRARFARRGDQRLGPAAASSQ